jgi:hypothetical protein
MFFSVKDRCGEVDDIDNDEESSSSSEEEVVSVLLQKH